MSLIQTSRMIVTTISPPPTNTPSSDYILEQEKQEFSSHMGITVMYALEEKYYSKDVQ